MNALHLLADLESRIAELQDLTNDAYDIAAGTLMPGITDLAPPATPQQEVFGGGGVAGGVVDDITNVSELAPPASWTVREIEEEVEQPVLDGEGNPVLNEDDTPKTETVKQKSWKVWSPLWQVGKTTYMPEGMAEGWNELPVTEGELFAILKVTGEYTANNGYNFDNPGYELSWINEDPSALPDYQDSDGVKFRWVKIGIFQQINGSAGFAQFHTGLIIDSTGSSSDVIGQPGKDGKDGVDGEDGVTWVPSLRQETVTTPNTDNSGSTSHEEVYLDFTNSQTGEVIKGTVNLKGPKGDTSDTSSGGETSGETSGKTVDLTYVKSITYANNVCTVTTATIKVLAVGEETTTSTPLFTTTGHSGQHKSPNTSY